MKTLRKLREALTLAFTSLMEIHDLVMDVVEALRTIQAIAEEARENVREELRAAAAEQRAARATEERIRRALNGAAAGAGDDPDAGGEGEPVRRMPAPRREAASLADGISEDELIRQYKLANGIN